MHVYIDIYIYRGRKNDKGFKNKLRKGGRARLEGNK